MDEKFILERYTDELTRKQQLNAWSLPIALLTAIGTALLAMIRTFTVQEVPITPACYVLVLAAGVALWPTDVQGPGGELLGKIGLLLLGVNT